MTTSRPRITTLSQSMVTKRGNRDCNVCGFKMRINGKIVAKKSHSFKLYHLKCAEEKNII
jgi:hypothetical protein